MKMKVMMMMLTEKPLYWELSWHLIGEAWWSQTNFDCTIWGGWGSHVGVVEGYQCDYLMKLELSLCTNGQTKVVVRMGVSGGQTSRGHFLHLPPFLGCWDGSVETSGHFRPLL